MASCRRCDGTGRTVAIVGNLAVETIAEGARLHLDLNRGVATIVCPDCGEVITTNIEDASGSITPSLTERYMRRQAE